MPAGDEYRDFDDEIGVMAAISSTVKNKNKVGGRGRLIPFVLVFMMIIGLIAVLWYFYPRQPGGENGNSDSVKTIKADQNDYRTVPDEEVNRIVAYRESTVFDPVYDARKSNSENVKSKIIEETTETEEKVENLLEETSDSVQEGDMKNVIAPPVGGSFAGLNTKPAVQNSSENNDIAGDLESEQNHEVNQEKGVDDLLEDLSTPEIKSEKKTQKTAEVKVPTDNAYYVQIASLKDEESAKTAWSRMQKKYSGILPSSEHRIKKVYIEGKGNYYRVQSGPYASKSAASAVCDEIKSKASGSCFVLKDR